MSDCHIGGWRNPTLRETGTRCFEKAIDLSIQEEVDFILIAGDLFDVPRPSIESMTQAVSKMKEARDHGIRIYLVEGSHDTSPTGKTMTRVLEKAGLFTRIAKGKKRDAGGLTLTLTEDKETGTKITGLPGRKGALEKEYYRGLQVQGLEEPGFKIFLFHSGLEELKTPELRHAQFMPISLLPKGFDYYAGGHVHNPRVEDWEGYGKIVYPGALFPEDFRELEELDTGFYTVTVTDSNIDLKWHDIDLYETVSVAIDAQDKPAHQVEEELKTQLQNKDVEDKFVLIRVEGALSSGRPSDIDFRAITTQLQERGAQLVRRNTAKLTTREYEEIKVQADTRQELEDKLIQEHAGQHDLHNLDKQDQVNLTKTLLELLAEEKDPDELVKDYTHRMKESMISALALRQEWNRWNED